MQNKTNTVSGHKALVRVYRFVSALRLSCSHIGASLLLTFALGFVIASTGMGATLTWVGDDISNLWDINTSQNWHDGSGASVYNDGDAVTLDDSGSATPDIDLAAAVAPASVTVDNTDKPYTIAGAGALTGTMPLNKSGTNTLSLKTANTFSGVVTVTGGILEFAPPSDVTMANMFTDTGGIGFRKSGEKKLTISGTSRTNNNYYCGWVVVDGGTLQFGTSTSVTYPGFYRATSYTVNSGTVLEIIAQTAMNVSAPLIVNGGTVRSTGYNPIGPLTLNGGILEAVNGLNGTYRAIGLNGHVTVDGSEPSIIRQAGSSNPGIHLAVGTGTRIKTFNVADVTGDADADLTVSAILRDSQTSAVCGLTKTGAGTMVMSADSIYTGTTTVNDGTLLVSGSLVSPTVNVNDGGTLLVSGSSPLPSATITIASNGTFGAAGAVATSVNHLTFAEGSKVSWTYDGTANTAGVVHVTGTLTLPTEATIDLSGTGALRSGQVLFSAADGTVDGATDLSGWTIDNAPEKTSAKVVLVDKQVVLNVFRGTLIKVF